MDKVPFYPKRIALGTALLAILMATLAWQSLSTGRLVFTLWEPVIFLGAILIMKWAAPKVPWSQLGGLLLTIFIVNVLALALKWPPAALIAEIAVQAICVFGFGAYWVAKGFIPGSVNRWK